MIAEIASPFPWAPLVATVLFLGLAIWALASRKRG
jgi:hypothetical protein